MDLPHPGTGPNLLFAGARRAEAFLDTAAPRESTES